MTPATGGGLYARLHPVPAVDRRPQWVQRAEAKALPPKENK